MNPRKLIVKSKNAPLCEIAPASDNAAMGLPERIAEAVRLAGGRHVLANRHGFRRSDLSRWSAGKHIPNAEALRRIAVATGVSADWLLGLDDEQPAPAHEVRAMQVYDTLYEEDAASMVAILGLAGLAIDEKHSRPLIREFYAVLAAAFSSGDKYRPATHDPVPLRGRGRKPFSPEKG